MKNVNKCAFNGIEVVIVHIWEVRVFYQNVHIFSLTYLLTIENTY